MGKLIAPIALKGLIEKSAIFTPPQLVKVQKACEGAGDATMVARRLIKEGVLTVWQARQLLGGYSALRVGKYKLVDELGAGPLGRVYLAEHMQLARRVALKLLPKRAKDGGDSTEALLATARKISGIDHRNIIHVYDVDFDTDFGRYYLVMEYALGVNLGKRLADTGPLRFTAAAEMARQVASGLSHAHQRNLVHLDLKPTNVMLDSQGGVKILDMGVAKLVEAAGRKTVSEGGANDESIQFQSPEVREQRKDLDGRADLFSLGRILYSALTGRVTFGDEAIPEVTAVRLETPAALSSIIGKLTSSDPEARYATAELLEKELEDWLGQQIVVVSDPELPATLPAGALSAPQLNRPVEFDSKSGSVPKKSVSPPSPPPAAENADPFSTVEMAAVVRVDASSSHPVLAPISDSAETPRIESGDFEIKLHPGRRRKKKPTELSEESGTKGEASRVSPAVLIVGGIVILIVVCSIMVAAIWNSLGSANSANVRVPSSALASATSGADARSAEQEKKEASPTKDGNALKRMREFVEQQSTDKSPANASTAATPEKPNSDRPVNSAGESNLTKPADPVPDVAAVTPNPEPAKSSESTNPPTVAKSIEPMPPTVNATPSATSPNATASANESPGAAPKPPADPFVEFPKTVSLPELGSSESSAAAPVSLGKILIDRTSFCIIHLHGGSSAIAKPRQRFVLKEVNNREWQVLFREGTGDSGGIDIAHVLLRDQQLMFHWTDEATPEHAAPYFSNCVLTIAAGPKSQDLALRKPVTGDPISLAELTKPIKGQWDLAATPRAEFLKIEFKLPTEAPRHKYEPSAELAIDKQSTYLGFLDKENEPIVAIKFDFNLRKNLLVTGTTFLKLSIDGDRLKFTPKLMTDRQKSLPRASQEAERIVGLAKLASEQKPTDEGLRNDALRAEEQFKVVQRAVGQFEQVKELMQQSASLKVHVRVTHTADEKKVVLLSTMP